MELISRKVADVQDLEVYGGAIVKFYKIVEEYDLTELGGVTYEATTIEVKIFDKNGDVMKGISLYPEYKEGTKLKARIQTTSYSSLSPDEAVEVAEEFLYTAKVYKDLYDGNIIGGVPMEIYEGLYDWNVIRAKK